MTYNEAWRAATAAVERGDLEEAERLLPLILPGVPRELMQKKIARARACSA